MLNDFTSDELDCLREMINEHKQKKVAEIYASYQMELLYKNKAREEQKPKTFLDKVTSFLSRNKKTLK